MGKVCTKCQQEKELLCFYKSIDAKDGLSSMCKECIKFYYARNKEKYVKKQKEYYSENKEVILEKTKIRRAKLETKEKMVKYRMDHADEKKEYRKQHKVETNSKDRIRYKTDSSYKVMRVLRARIRKALKFYSVKKTQKSISLLGCDIRFYKKHIEKYFQSDMNWNNHGYVWHIDHIVPISFFDLEDESEQKIAFHYGNTQPMYKEENIKKYDSIPKDNFKY